MIQFLECLGFFENLVNLVSRHCLVNLNFLNSCFLLGKKMLAEENLSESSLP
jgi:hypothetical protein